MQPLMKLCILNMLNSVPICVSIDPVCPTAFIISSHIRISVLAFLYYKSFLLMLKEVFNSYEV